MADEFRKQPAKNAACETIEQDDARSRYWLSQHVHVCLTTNGAIFLDLKQDQYFGLAPEDTLALTTVLCGLPSEQLTNSGLPLDMRQPGLSLARELAAQGLLTTDETVGKPAVPTALAEQPNLIAIGQDPRAPLRIGIGHVCTFVASCLDAIISLKCCSLESVVARVQRSHCNQSFDPSRAAELVWIFRRLRTYTFTTKDRCLMHALALTKFLRRHGVPCVWVIGVRSMPFSAHSWVQQGDMVLDGTPEQVGFFTPVLAVN